MTSSDLDRLRFLMAGLRETQVTKDTERRLLAEFQRLWPRPSSPRLQSRSS